VSDLRSSANKGRQISIDEVLDLEFGPAPDHEPGKIRRCCLCQGRLKTHEYQVCRDCDLQTC